MRIAKRIWSTRRILAVVTSAEEHAEIVYCFIEAVCEPAVSNASKTVEKAGFVAQYAGYADDYFGILLC